MRYRTAAMSALFLAALSVASAQETRVPVSALTALLPGLNESEISVLARTGSLASEFERTGRSAVPNTRLAPEFAAEILTRLSEIEPTIGVEVLVVRRLPTTRPVGGESLASALSAISTMQGIEYYSATRDRMRILFHESHVIAGADDRRVQPDPTPVPGESTATIHVFQRDSSFGSNVLELDYRWTQRAVWLQMTNLTQMYYQGFIPAVRPEELRLHIVVHVEGDIVLFYGASAARTGFLMGMEERVERSFYNRLVALSEWFMARIGEIDS